ncbi:MAG: glycosyltransferase family 39 protein [Deltaproteobacteria bacterium]|nr:glycosyltransferase family 39 protein [Deltaproteobacteria bacterium]
MSDDSPSTPPPPSPDEPAGADAGSTPSAESSAASASSPAEAAATEVARDAARPETSGSASAPSSTSLTDQARRLRLPWARSRTAGVVVFVLAGVALALMMANEGQLPRGALIGLVVALVGAAGLLEALGVRTLDVARSAAGLVATRSVDWKGVLLHPGTLGALAAIALLAPSIGRFALWDPWETHYGEVAREILARDDWISLWWCQDGWFFSKPILIFWTEAISLSAFGINYLPDANPANSEIAIRFPVFLFSVAAVSLCATAVGRVWGRRAGIVAGLVLATTPHFFLLSHQAITDMFFGASVAMAMSCLLLALTTDPDRQAPVVRIGPLVLSARHLVLGLLIAVALPQILYLVTRNVTMVEGFRFAWHVDRFESGSAGNDQVPGNQPGAPATPVVKWLQPIIQGGIWAVMLVGLIALTRKETRVRHLWLLAFYFFAALGFMGKGIPGIALPGLVALLYLVATRKWSLLRDLRIGSGVLLTIVVAAPWFVACTVRHGDQFINRLLIHDHINRLASGVHGDTGSVQYFIWQIGYSAFPWIALAPAAIVSFLWSAKARSGSDDDPRTIGYRLLSLWFAASFALFSIMVTKFHHYIFPAVPPLALLVAVLLDRYLAAAPTLREPIRLFGGIGGALVGVVALAIGIAGLLGDPRGVHPYVERAPGASTRDATLASRDRVERLRASAWSPVPCAALIGVGALLLGVVAWSWRRRDGIEEDETTADRVQGATGGEQTAGAAAGVVPVGAAAPPPPAGAAQMSGPDPAARAAATRQIILGAGILVVGLGVTGATYSAASESPSGGSYVIAYGAILAGIVRIITALVRLQGATVQAPLVPATAGASGGSPPSGSSDGAPETGEGAPSASASEDVPSPVRVLLEGHWRSVALGAAAVAGAIVVGFVGRDLAWVTTAKPAGYERLIHLFVYNYERVWPDVFDYSPILTGFAVVATLLAFLLAFRRVRAGASLGLLAFGVVFTYWTLDVYMLDLTPHWSQGPAIRKYYEVRRGPHEEILAFQMNWKGENFYTGNRVGVFVDLDTTALRRWADQHRGQRHFFLTEPSRLNGLRSALGGNVEVEHITTERDNNKFVLVAVRL